MADTGAHILELDSKVDLGVAKGRVGRRVCLMGNLSPAEVSCGKARRRRSKPPRSKPSLRRQKAVASSSARAAKCRRRTAENIHAMIRAARRTRFRGVAPRRLIESSAYEERNLSFGLMAAGSILVSPCPAAEVIPARGTDERMVRQSCQVVS